MLRLVQELQFIGKNEPPLHPSLPIELSESFFNQQTDRSRWHFDERVQRIVDLGPDAMASIFGVH